MNTSTRKSKLTGRVLFPSVLLLFTWGCAQTNPSPVQPGARGQIVENLEPMVKMEERGAKLVVVMQHLPQIAKITPDDARRLKEHYSVYYVYHGAATVMLAEGNLKAYHDHIKVASQELDSLEAKLKNMVESSSAANP
jgi:hypothetical protein